MQKVYILATCRNPELLPATLLVFDSIRVGFPTADIIVHKNGDSDYVGNSWQLHRAVEQANGSLVPGYVGCDGIDHHRWIEGLIRRENEPFFICDTDVIFWDNFERFDFGHLALAGRYIPQFFDEFTNCITKPRLHTSLMYIDPVKVRREMEAYYSQFPQGKPFNHMRPNLIEPRIFPDREIGSYFHDTCSQLYHAIGGSRFNETLLNRYDHLHAGTYSDLLGPRMTLAKNIQATHQQIFENPQLAKGCWRAQESYYAHFKA